MNEELNKLIYSINDDIQILDILDDIQKNNLRIKLTTIRYMVGDLNFKNLKTYNQILENLNN